MIVKVTSSKAFPCSVISIQDVLVRVLPSDTARAGSREGPGPCICLSPPPLQCPVYDLDNNVAFIGMYQTMTKKAAITVQVGRARGRGEMWPGSPGSLSPSHYVPPTRLRLWVPWCT